MGPVVTDWIIRDSISRAGRNRGRGVRWLRRLEKWAEGVALLSTEGTAGESPQRSTDGHLIAGLARRDEAALLALIQAHGSHVYGRALHVLIDPQLAERVATETLLLLWGAPFRFDESKGCVRDFLMGCALVKAIEIVRREDTVTSKPSDHELNEIIFELHPSGAAARSEPSA